VNLRPIKSAEASNLKSNYSAVTSAAGGGNGHSGQYFSNYKSNSNSSSSSGGGNYKGKDASLKAKPFSNANGKPNPFLPDTSNTRTKKIGKGSLTVKAVSISMPKGNCSRHPNGTHADKDCYPLPANAAKRPLPTQSIRREL
jgi:hypothetical protein